MDSNQILKEINSYVVNGKLTYDDFEKIFGFLPRKEQYSVVCAIEDDLNIKLVDEIIVQIDKNISAEEIAVNKVAEKSVADNVAPTVFREANEIKTSNDILIKLIQSGDKQASQDLCVKNRGLVEKFVARYEKFLSTQLTFEDLVQEGMIGMLKAAEKFDFSKEAAFSTYASPWIMQSITREIMDTGLAIRLPAHIVEKILKVTRLERKFLINGFNLRQRIELIFKETDMKSADVSKLFSLRATYLNIISLDKPINEEENDSLLCDFIKDEKTLDPAQAASSAILREHIETVLDTLTPRERKILKLRYGFEDGRERTLEEIGQIFNLTRERIRQIETQALTKLRHPKHSKKLRDFLN